MRARSPASPCKSVLAAIPLRSVDARAENLRGALATLLGAFVLFGIFWGTFAVLLADLSGALELSPGPLGLALFIGAAFSIAAMALLRWAADRLGRRFFILGSLAVFAAGIACLALTESYAVLILALALLYSSSGLYDVGINAAAVDLERASGRRFMNVLHAAFSIGAVAGALSAGALLSFGLDYRIVYLLVLAPLFMVAGSVALVDLPPPGESPDGVKENGRWNLFRSAPLLLVALIATLALLAEGEMEHWSGVYLRRSLGLSALVGGSGVAVFYAAMAAGRLGAAWAVNRFGDPPHHHRSGGARLRRDGALARYQRARSRRHRVPHRRPRSRRSGPRPSPSPGTLRPEGPARPSPSSPLWATGGS
jgi:MFS family permease